MIASGKSSGACMSRKSSNKYYNDPARILIEAIHLAGEIDAQLRTCVNTNDNVTGRLNEVANVAHQLWRKIGRLRRVMKKEAA